MPCRNQGRQSICVTLRLRGAPHPVAHLDYETGWLRERITLARAVSSTRHPPRLPTLCACARTCVPEHAVVVVALVFDAFLGLYRAELSEGFIFKSCCVHCSTSQDFCYPYQVQGSLRLQSSHARSRHLLVLPQNPGNCRTQ